MFTRLSSLPEDFSDRGCSFEPPPGSRFAPSAAKGLSTARRRAGNQRTLYASFHLLHRLRLCAGLIDRSRPGSTVCFALASMDHPEPIRLIFGKSAGDLEQAAWDSVNAVDSSKRDDGGLSMVLWMTRLDDLGLGQLLFS